ncbi:MAG: FAD-dependent oxidoreductase [Proteobacteria bacterium]|nr:FAD-dependent oxidoreductase [Pseudomonadota bacterium]
MINKFVITGGVAGGATAAARLRRLDEHAEIILLDRGEYISFANCGLPYYIGGIIKKREDLLVTTAQDFSLRYRIDIRPFSEVTAIDRKNKQVHIKDHQTGKSYRETYGKLILSPGAAPLKPPLEGIDDPRIFTLRNIPDTDSIKQFIDTQKPKHAVVVGGGFIGLEMAENLVFRGAKVTVIEMADQVMTSIDPEMAHFVHGHLKRKGVLLELKNGITGFLAKGDHLAVKTSSGRVIDCDMVLLAAGVRPENELAVQAGLPTGKRGGILVNNALQTQDPDIYAVGDAIETRELTTGLETMTPLAGPANKQGRIAADNVSGRRSTFKGTLGTSVAKVFDLTVASTGKNEKSLLAQAVPYKKSYTTSGSHASYYPGSESMTIKLLFSPSSGKVLGAQVVGGKGVDKRVDVLATAIKGGLTVYDLEELELAYAPPYSSAKDPVNVAGFVAANILKGDVVTVYSEDLKDLDPQTHVILDLRTPIEIKMLGALQGSINIPVDDLRGRMGELDPDKTYILYCAVGIRAYIAYRILVQHGFTAKNLSGGFTLCGHL